MGWQDLNWGTLRWWARWRVYFVRCLCCLVADGFMLPWHDKVRKFCLAQVIYDNNVQFKAKYQDFSSWINLSLWNCQVCWLRRRKRWHIAITQTIRNNVSRCHAKDFFPLSEYSFHWPGCWHFLRREVINFLMRWTNFYVCCVELEHFFDCHVRANGSIKEWALSVKCTVIWLKNCIFFTFLKWIGMALGP